LISIEDITPFVAEQRLHLADNFSGLKTPKEEVYRPTDQLAAMSVGIDEWRTN